MNFIEELKWRGMIHDMMSGLEAQLEKELTSAYVGIDPTADSLHIGHLVGLMMLKHFQIAGHKPIVLVGGATGMIGDPSGKSQERNLLDEKTLSHNQECLKIQISKFLDFDTTSKNSAEMVNNYDWMKEFTFLNFIRDIGKHITINYMMAKDSVKTRLNPDSGVGMSFTEFTYQLVQGADFLHLYENKNCKLQMGGSDQWGNITTGTDLIRKKNGGDAFALTCPLIKKSDGTKFGKTESGNIWLDPIRTSPYKFYQFWLNTSDDDAEKYIKIFTVLSKEEIDEIISEHQQARHLRKIQKVLAREVTSMVHSEEDCNLAIEASAILFGKGTEDTLRKLNEDTFLSIFKGVPTFFIHMSDFNKGINIINLLTVNTSIFTSNGDVNRTISGGGISINKVKIKGSDEIISSSNLIGDKYILVQKGKNNYFIIIAIENGI